MLEESLGHMSFLEAIIEKISTTIPNFNFNSLKNEYTNEAKNNELGLNILKQNINRDNTPNLLTKDAKKLRKEINEMLIERKKGIDIKRKSYISTPKVSLKFENECKIIQMPIPTQKQENYTPIECEKKFGIISEDDDKENRYKKVKTPTKLMPILEDGVADRTPDIIRSTRIRATKRLKELNNHPKSAKKIKF